MVAFKDLLSLFYLGIYYPEYDSDGENIYDNPFFNEYSARILDLKEKDSEAIRFFTRELNNILDDEDITLAIVPSSRSTDSSSGICDLARHLIRLKNQFVDGTLCVKRVRVINRSSPTRSLSNRTIEKHLQTLEIKNLELVRDRNVILLDDVITTGNSINACKQLLLEAGSREVKSIVLGKTFRLEPSIGHDFIDWKLQRDSDDINMSLELELESIRRNHADYLQGLELEALDRHGRIERDAEDEREYIDEDDYDALYELDSRTVELHEEVDIAHSEESFQNYQELEEAIGRVKEMASEGEDWYTEQATEAHQVLEGDTCFSPYNPFIASLASLVDDQFR